MRNESKDILLVYWGMIFVLFDIKFNIDQPWIFDERFEYEHICWDPKDGELCLGRVKSGETLMEARSDSDVQIDRNTWV